MRKGNEGTPRIDMRGLRSRHVLLLLDGIPFNSTEDGQFDPVLIPAELMQSVRIDFGNASVLHGDGPIGGVLQVVTRTAEAGVQTHAGFDVRSGDQYFVDLAVSGRAGDFDALAAGSGFGRDAFPLSDDFDASTSEDGGARPGHPRPGSQRAAGRAGAARGFAAKHADALKQERAGRRAAHSGSQSSSRYTTPGSVISRRGRAGSDSFPQRRTSPNVRARLAGPPSSAGIKTKPLAIKTASTVPSCGVIR